MHSLAVFLAVGLLHWSAIVEAQSTARWCTTSGPESNKCVAMRNKFAAKGLQPGIVCVVGKSVQECMRLIQDNGADLITLDGGDVYVAGKDYNMVPIMEEVYEQGKRGYYAVAVVKKSNTAINISNLRGKRSCHTGIRKTAGWNVPIGFLLENNYITPEDCQQDIKAAGQFFSASCVPGVLSDAYNPSGDNPRNLCQACKSPQCERNSNEAYYNYAGAFRCLAEDAGDVAFIKPQTVLDNTDNKNQDTWAINLASNDFELLCPDGSRKPVSEAASCNLALVPPHAVMTAKTKTANAISTYQNLLTNAQEIFGADTNTEGFLMFDSYAWSDSDLIFKDSTIRLDKITNKNYAQFLGDSYVGTIQGINKCPSNTLRWCVISDQELDKCRAMSAAFKVKGLTPEISCFREMDHDGCMKSIYDDEADVVTLDGGDIFQAGTRYQLRPVLAEYYQEQSDASYWAVAVVKSSSSFTINDLKGKKSCHTGIMKSSGWVVPIGHLIDRGDISVEGCDVAVAVGNFFSASCVPGAQSPAYDLTNSNPDNLCQLCTGTNDNKCVRNANEPYYGYDGAFRCLVEGAGDVAFVKHTTVSSTLGSSMEFPWASSSTKNDFQLLCRDGGRGAVDDWQTCNLAKIASHALVTSSKKTTTQRSQIADLLLNAQKHFGHDTNNQGFRMFDSSGYAANGNAGSDLLFKDATIYLADVGARDEYDEYLSPEYVKDLHAINCDSTNDAAYLHPSITILLLLVAILKAI
ncbi:melanotransferrin-like [Amphiura filiformis]|uniref:melanotransferrin-like n=1 Tax=Amphiura filiformis TaxID=82378 RepID=UPI003B219562